MIRNHAKYKERLKLATKCMKEGKDPQYIYESIVSKYDNMWEHAFSEDNLCAIVDNVRFIVDGRQIVKISWICLKEPWNMSSAKNKRSKKHVICFA